MTAPSRKHSPRPRSPHPTPPSPTRLHSTPHHATPHPGDRTAAPPGIQPAPPPPPFHSSQFNPFRSGRRAAWRGVAWPGAAWRGVARRGVSVRAPRVYREPPEVMTDPPPPNHHNNLGQRIDNSISFHSISFHLIPFRASQENRTFRTSPVEIAAPHSWGASVHRLPEILYRQNREKCTKCNRGPTKARAGPLLFRPTLIKRIFRESLVAGFARG